MHVAWSAVLRDMFLLYFLAKLPGVIFFLLPSLLSLFLFTLGVSATNSIIGTIPDVYVIALEILIVAIGFTFSYVWAFPQPWLHIGTVFLLLSAISAPNLFFGTPISTWILGGGQIFATMLVGGLLGMAWTSSFSNRTRI